MGFILRNYTWVLGDFAAEILPQKKTAECAHIRVFVLLFCFFLACAPKAKLLSQSCLASLCNDVRTLVICSNRFVLNIIRFITMCYFVFWLEWLWVAVWSIVLILQYGYFFFHSVIFFCDGLISTACQVCVSTWTVLLQVSPFTVLSWLCVRFFFLYCIMHIFVVIMYVVVLTMYMTLGMPGGWSKLSCSVRSMT